MNPADRRTIHKLAGEYGIETESEGFGRDRHIVLKPALIPSEDAALGTDPVDESEDAKNEE
jgi:hypothetical protein